MSHDTHVSVEPGGYVATCACGWLRWAPVESLAHQHRRAHETQHRPREEKS